MFKTKKRIIVLCIVAILVIASVVWIAWGNTALELNTTRVTNSTLPSAFNGFRIAQISDLHNTTIGNDNETLLTLLEQADPDIIVITGDMIDSRNTKVDVALKFAEHATAIAPCYYVSGNHESRVTEYGALKEGLKARGVTVLENAKTTLTVSGESITLIGVDDPTLCSDASLAAKTEQFMMNDTLNKLVNEQDGFTVLLSHRPELFDTYVTHGVDLVFSGHAHGGQFRLPFVGGVIAPHQGLFPKYDAGLYTEQHTTMIVSRGIGNSILPFRVNNRPELVLVELAC